MLQTQINQKKHCVIGQRKTKNVIVINDCIALKQQAYVSRQFMPNIVRMFELYIANVKECNGASTQYTWFKTPIMNCDISQAWLVGCGVIHNIVIYDVPH
jgi:hypothetical protein